jgi:branched-chain amino acid transport system permease protein
MRSSAHQKKIGLLLAGLILIFLPFVIKSQHLMHIIILAGLESIVVMGFVAQHNVKLITFCTAAFWGIGAYISGFLSTKFGLSFWPCLALAGIGTALFAFVLGSIVIRAGWVTFLMISIVLGEVFVEALGHMSVVGGWDGITNIPRPAIGSFVFVSKSSYYYLTLGLTSVCALIFVAFYKSAIGKAWTAINQSPELAASIGIDIFKYRMIAYVAAGFTTGLSGSLYAHYSCYLVPQTFGILRSLYLSINAAVGGLYFFISGPVVGSLIIKAVPEYLRITDKYEPIFEGAMIILIALFFRKGILSIFWKGTARSL